jgi:hypothetical protein
LEAGRLSRLPDRPVRDLESEALHFESAVVVHYVAVFLGFLGLLLGILVMLSGAITFVRGLPQEVELKPGQSDPQGNPHFLISQETLGLGVVLLALDIVLHLDSRPYLVPGILLLIISVVDRVLARRRRTPS